MLGTIQSTVVGVVGSAGILALIIWLNNRHTSHLRRDGRISNDPVYPKDGTNFLEVVGFTAIVLVAVALLIAIVRALG